MNEIIFTVNGRRIRLVNFHNEGEKVTQGTWLLERAQAVSFRPAGMQALSFLLQNRTVIATRIHGCRLVFADSPNPNLEHADEVESMTYSELGGWREGWADTKMAWNQNTWFVEETDSSSS